MKMVREQLPDENDAATPMAITPAQKSPLPLDSIRPIPPSDLKQLALPFQPSTQVREPALPPLKRTLLKRNNDKTRRSGMYAAEYSGKPVLVEYNKVAPATKAKLRLRAKNLAILLSQPKQPGFWTLNCLGFLEDTGEFAFVYDYPQPQPSNTPTFRSLQDHLGDSKALAPSVSVRIKLALDICRTLLTVHTAGWLHKNVCSENILFFPSDPPLGDSFSSPYLTGFAFSRVNSTMEMSDS